MLDAALMREKVENLFCENVHTKIMVTDLEPPQTGFTISMFLIEKKQQVILFPRQKLLHKHRGSLNSL